MYIVTLECGDKHSFNPNDFSKDIPIRGVPDSNSIQLALSSDKVLYWLLTYYADGYMTYIYKIVNIEEEK